MAPIPSERGQTTLDYAIGIGLFLLAAALVFGLLPGLDRPTVGATTDLATADRVAARLTSDVLTRPHSPADLNATCTERFYNGTAPHSCPSSRPSTGNLSHVLGTGDTVRVNTTIEHDGRLSSLNTTGNRTWLGIGPEPPGGGVPVTAVRRTVRLNGTIHRLHVRVW
jgi:hypothetical protein